MDSARFAVANELWHSGRVEDAACEFRSMALQADYSDEKAALLANEHKCYCQLGSFDKAQRVMREIRKLKVHDNYIRMIIDIGDGCMMTQIGKEEEGLSILSQVLEANREELLSPEFGHLYEEIQRRRGFALTNLKKYKDAISVLEEAAAFADTSPDDMQSVCLFLGTCYAAVSKSTLAKGAYLRAIAYHLGDANEAEAHYRVAILYFQDRAFAQAKHHLEAALQLPDTAIGTQLRKYIYEQMSRVCHYLGESEEAQKYLSLSRQVGS